ncbi:DMT family transporter [Pseudomonas sp. R5(2019)]|uniref:DMT family transporter n=1 Tax=Pseudomonas sp. R5(2019) TaxID=2697566 RepID=UPI0014136119|nr:DMT family transporter [Pseudomonas sp. R5(2019)]NBA97572.1 EamA family transporter [Pseudomonas sp. R5(2019)]
MNPGYVYVLLCYALIGISYPIAKEAMTLIPIWIFTSITFAVAFALLYPVVRTLDRIALSQIGLPAWVAISIQSLLGAVLYTVFLLYGFSGATAIVASVFSSLAPAAVLTFSSVFLKERLSVRKVLAIVMAVAGVLVLTLPTADSAGQNTWLGMLFLLLSTLSTAGCVISAKKLDVQLPPATLAAGVCLTGMLFTLPMAIAQGLSFDWYLLSAANGAVMIYYGALVWAVPYVLFFMGVTKIPASATGMAVAVIPLTASFFSMVFYREQLHLTDGVALVLVTLSILAAEAKEPIKPTLPATL